MNIASLASKCAHWRASVELVTQSHGHPAAGNGLPCTISLGHPEQLACRYVPSTSSCEQYTRIGIAGASLTCQHVGIRPRLLFELDPHAPCRSCGPI